MKKRWLLLSHWKTILILMLSLSLPLIAAWFVSRYISQDVFFKQRESHLTAFANMLELQLGEGGYDEILQNEGAQNLSNEEKIIVLNKILQPATDEIAASYPGLGLGFYSLELDAIITYGPFEEFGYTVGQAIAAEHPGRQVMQHNTPMVRTGSMVRGDIMNAMIPLERGGQVIGYIWANELVTDLQTALTRSSVIILLLLLAAYIFMLITISFFIRRIVRTEKKSRHALEDAAIETMRLDRMIQMVNQAVIMLLSADDANFEVELENCTEMIADIFSVDRIFIWHFIPELDKNYELLFSWQRTPINSNSEFYKMLNETPYLSFIKSWQTRLWDNESITSFASTATGESKALLDKFEAVSAISVPVFLQDNFWGVVGFSNIQHERVFKANEEAILRSSALLMANVISRNDFMQRLRKAHEDALAGTRAKSAFLARMSHEMRTPLNAIMGMASVGSNANDIEQKNASFDKIQDASSHLLGVISDILDVSKVEAGKLTLSPAAFSFDSVIEQVLQFMRYRIEEKNQTLNIDIDSNIPQNLYGDKQRLIQLILNLVSNANKFTPQNGSIGLSARLIETKDDECRLRFCISDSGIGIEKDKLDSIFDSFEQAESHITRKYGGTGLGLAISKNIAELMNGQIWANSEQGKGSEFLFEIQIQLDKTPVLQPVADMPASETAFEENSDPDFSNRHILLAEDVEINKEIMVALLEPTGLEIDWAVNGLEAFNMYKENPARYDLIFMDIQMPEMNGYEATEQIRSLPFDEAKNIPIVATSANAFKEDVDNCLKAGMNGHLAKPIELELVLKTLSKYLL